MNEDPEEMCEGSGKAEVYRIAQLPVRGKSGMDRRMFVKATVAGAGAAAVLSVSAGCGGSGD